MNKEQFVKAIKEDFKDVPHNFFDQIEKYKLFLQDYNKKINLTRLDSDSKIYGLYFYESLIPYKNIDFTQINDVLDIGSGSGIPGVVLKLLFPHINLTIIESSNKKSIFLSLLCKELNIDSNIITNRAEVLARELNESFDFVTSRAVTSLEAIIEISIRYVKINKWLIEPRANDINENNNISKFVEKFGGTLKEINSFKSRNDIQHNVVVVQKKTPTPNIYPRKWSDIVKDK